MCEEMRTRRRRADAGEAVSLFEPEKPRSKSGSECGGLRHSTDLIRGAYRWRQLEACRKGRGNAFLELGHLNWLVLGKRTLAHLAETVDEKTKSVRPACVEARARRKEEHLERANDAKKQLATQKYSAQR